MLGGEVSAHLQTPGIFRSPPPSPAPQHIRTPHTVPTYAVALLKTECCSHRGAKDSHDCRGSWMLLPVPCKLQLHLVSHLDHRAPQPVSCGAGAEGTWCVRGDRLVPAKV